MGRSGGSLISTGNGGSAHAAAAGCLAVLPCALAHNKPVVSELMYMRGRNTV